MSQGEFLKNISNLLPKKIPLMGAGPWHINNKNIRPTPSGYQPGAFIEAESIPEYAHPIARYIHENRPDYVFACDRGARLFALAVMMLHSNLYGQLPTQDHLMNFRRYTKSDWNTTMSVISSDTAAILSVKEEASVLVLDDWVNDGTTRDLVKSTFDKSSKGKIKVTFGVMVGPGADISGNPGLTDVITDHQDVVGLLGVDYEDRSAKAIAYPGYDSAQYRRRIVKAVRDYCDLQRLLDTADKFKK